MDSVLKHGARLRQNYDGHLDRHLLLMVLKVKDDSLLLDQGCKSLDVVNTVVD